MSNIQSHVVALGLFWVCVVLTPAAFGAEADTPDAAADSNARPARDDADLRRWLQNMVWHHRFTSAEISAAIGLKQDEIAKHLKRFDIRGDNRPKRPDDSPLLVLPYPGGRHPRIGFLDGAIDPQRETKVSVFTPWDASAYVVLDVPEAIWWQNGGRRELLYLAHTHVPTVWSKQGVKLKPLEWERKPDGTLRVERKLPNGVVFGTSVTPERSGVRLHMWLKNGTDKTLTGLVVQNCVMLRGVPQFAQQINDNKHIAKPYVATRSKDGKRWVITAWDPCHRVWANPPCPCMHSDPKFPDCPPGKTVHLRGWLSFYEGHKIDAELRRIDQLKWR